MLRKPLLRCSVGKAFPASPAPCLMDEINLDRDELQAALVEQKEDTATLPPCGS